jgi:hypothetical protein
MRKIVYSGILAASLLAPVAASAQTPAPAAPATEQLIVLRPGQLLAIGAGLVVGALAFQVAVPTRLGLIAGAVIGGYLGDFWYTGSQLELHVITPKS